MYPSIVVSLNHRSSHNIEKECLIQEIPNFKIPNTQQLLLIHSQFGNPLSPLDQIAMEASNLNHCQPSQVRFFDDLTAFSTLLTTDTVTMVVRMNPVKRRYCRVHKHTSVSWGCREGGRALHASYGRDVVPYELPTYTSTQHFAREQVCSNESRAITYDE